MSIETIRARSPVPEVCHVFPAAKKPWRLEEKEATHEPTAH